MAYIYRFGPASMNAAQYDDIINRLEKAGAGAPQGRIYHACYGQPDALHVFDVWESQEQFERFGAVLMPILQQVGVDPGTPEVHGVHNMIAG